MKKKTDRKLLEEIVADFQKALSQLGITNILIRPRMKGDDGYLEESKNRDDWAFAVDVPYPYREVIFHVSPRGFSSKRDSKSGVYKICIIHEAIHVLHSRFYHLSLDRHTSEKELADEEEQLADKLAIILSKYL